MPWSTSDRRERLPADWQRIRRRILRRYGGTCRALDSLGRRCGYPATDVDHIAPGDDHRDGNLQALCSWHHGRKSSAEGRAARRDRPTQRREPEPHPAMR